MTIKELVCIESSKDNSLIQKSISSDGLIQGTILLPLSWITIDTPSERQLPTVISLAAGSKVDYFKTKNLVNGKIKVHHPRSRRIVVPKGSFELRVITTDLKDQTYSSFICGTNLNNSRRINLLENISL